ncbi:MAG: hypothetical protein AB7O67_16010 [Vicinamibacterales bacterium]
MANARRTGWTLALAAGVVAAVAASAQSVQPTNDAPNPYETIDGYFKMPAGREWGSTSAVDIAPDGRSIWVAERCASNNCWDFEKDQSKPLDTVFLFDQSGKYVRSFGQGLMVFPHGIYVDTAGNVWVTDAADNRPRRPRNAPADAPEPKGPSKLLGNQVFKFSPEGKLLMTIGKPGGHVPGTPGRQPGDLYQPNDVITNDKGEIYITQGHGSEYAKIAKFAPDGTFIKEWGEYGSGPDQMDQPHALAWDSKGRLFVADRSNNRIKVFDQDGKLLETGYEQFSRLSGIFITKDDILYGADSESGSVEPKRADWKRGIRVGDLKQGQDAKIIALIPDPEPDPRKAYNAITSAAEGVAVDAAGNVYGAEVGPRSLKKYVKK